MTRWWRAPAILVRTFGWRGVARRIVHELRCASGHFQMRPAKVTIAAGSRPTCVYAPNGDWSAVPEWRRRAAVARGQRVLSGSYEAFGHHWRALPTGAAWHRHPDSGFTFPVSPWWRVPHSVNSVDIKDVWEPGRFAWVYDLVRAYALTGDRVYADAFYERLAEWRAANPAYFGPQWACGQETAIRALAILHACNALPLPAGDETRAAENVQSVLAASAERVADAIGYGLSQRNNHGISEAAALVHLGLYFHARHPDADGWRARGERELDEQICDQFASDGWYAQHSFTYMRLALEQALLAHRALARHGGSLSSLALRRLERGLSLLATLAAPGSGHLPNHGGNDGGRAVLYSTAEYRDFRPLLTLGACVLGVPLPADLAPDPETLAWVGASCPPAAAARGDTLVTGISGWAAARIGDAAVFVRAGTHTHRPAHLDPLHVDVRFGDRELVVDPGSFAYNAAPPWRNALVSSRVHNGPVMDDEEPARRGPRFLWWSWPSAAIVHTRFAEGRAEIHCERARLVRRAILIAPDEVTITDSVLHAGVRSVQVSWLLHPEMRHTDAVLADGVEVVHAAEGSVDGWFSPTYGLREPSALRRIRREGTAVYTPIVTRIRRPHALARLAANQ